MKQRIGTFLLVVTLSKPQGANTSIAVHDIADISADLKMYQYKVVFVSTNYHWKNAHNRTVTRLALAKRVIKPRRVHPLLLEIALLIS
jgi:hypothetical protein